MRPDGSADTRCTEVVKVSKLFGVEGVAYDSKGKNKQRRKKKPMPWFTAADTISECGDSWLDTVESWKIGRAHV